MKRNLLFFLFIMLCLSVFSQNRIAKGFVFDEKTKAPIDSAVVAVYDTAIKTYTDVMGYYTIQLPKRRRQLKFMHKEYESQQILLRPGFQHRNTNVYLKSSKAREAEEKRQKKLDSKFLAYKNSISLSLLEVFQVAVAGRYERFIKKKHSIGAHASVYVYGRNPTIGGSEHTYYHEYVGFKLAPAYRFFPVRKNTKGLFIEAKVPFGYINFTKLDYHSSSYTHLDVYKQYDTWIVGYSICVGISSLLPRTKHGIITLSIGYQHFPLDIPETASRVINDEVTLSFPTNVDWWYVSGPGGYFELKLLVGGIF